MVKQNLQKQKKIQKDLLVQRRRRTYKADKSQKRETTLNKYQKYRKRMVILKVQEKNFLSTITLHQIYILIPKGQRRKVSRNLETLKTAMKTYSIQRDLGNLGTLQQQRTVNKQHLKSENYSSNSRSQQRKIIGLKELMLICQLCNHKLTKPSHKTIWMISFQMA